LTHVSDDPKKYSSCFISQTTPPSFIHRLSSWYKMQQDSTSLPSPIALL